MDLPGVWILFFSLHFTTIHSLTDTRLTVSEASKPANTSSCTFGNETLVAGQNVSISELVFECRLGPQGEMSLQTVACLDEDGDVLGVGEARYSRNGNTLVSCTIPNAIVTKEVEHLAGCFYNGSVYRVEEEWKEPNPDVLSDVSHVWMSCNRTESGYFEKRIVACDLDGEPIHLSSELPESTLKCIEAEPGHVTLVPVTPQEIACTVGEAVHAHGERWNSTAQSGSFYCELGKVHKEKCLVGGHTVGLYEQVLLANDGCVFRCHPLGNIYTCDGQVSFLEPLLEN